MRFGPAVPPDFTCPDCCSANKQDCEVGLPFIVFLPDLPSVDTSGSGPNVQARAGLSASAVPDVMYPCGWEPGQRIGGDAAGPGNHGK
jgi:hypothetical protein